MADPRTLSPEMDTLAAELAFGLLEGEERLEAERLRLADAAFAAAVEQWQAVGLGWLDEQPGDEPSAAMWPRIEATVARRPVAMPSEAPQQAPARQVERVRDAGPWKPFALAASLAALVFAGLWAFAEPQRIEVPVEQPLQPGALSVAQINGAPEQGMLLSALYDRETGKLYLRLADLPDANRVPQLWLIDGSGTPRSLGFGQRGAASELQLTAAQRAIIEGAGTIAVSLEAPAAVPHEAPTDVLGAANLAPLDQS